MLDLTENTQRLPPGSIAGAITPRKKVGRSQFLSESDLRHSNVGGRVDDRPESVQWLAAICPAGVTLRFLRHSFADETEE